MNDPFERFASAKVPGFLRVTIEDLVDDSDLLAAAAQSEHKSLRIKANIAGHRRIRTLHQYDDTAAGAIAALNDLANFDLAGATAEPDPVVEGVWMVHMPAEDPRGNAEAIVYLKGYKTVWGHIRPVNDCESNIG